MKKKLKKVYPKTERYPWLGVLYIALCVLFKMFNYIKENVVLKPRNSDANHDAKVKEIQQQVRKWKDSGNNVPMCTSRPQWKALTTRHTTYKKTFFQVNIDLHNILEINTESRFIKVEPRVSIGQLTSALCDIGWIMPVVPELDELTIGGLINGAGIETSSHKYGLFQNTCLAYELVLCDGSFTRCTKDENEDLFYAIPWSHGTLGFLVAAEIMIIPSKKYVKLEYLPLYTSDDVTEKFITECKKNEPHFFVEGIVYSSNTGVIMVGDMTDEVQQDKINNVNRWYKRAFYKHVETFLNEGRHEVEYIPLRDYLHRHTRNYFWVVACMLPFVDNVFFRYLFGWAFPLDGKLVKRFQSDCDFDELENAFVLQDMVVPSHSLKRMIVLADEVLNLYPVWLCGAYVDKVPGFIHPKGAEEMYVDVGLYGIPQVNNYDAVETIRNLEAFVRKNNGIQALYAITYMTEKEFRQMFDHTLYDQLRIKLDCKKAFPEVYKKVCHKKFFFKFNQ